MDTKVLNSSNN